MNDFFLVKNTFQTNNEALSSTFDPSALRKPKTNAGALGTPWSLPNNFAGFPHVSPRLAHDEELQLGADWVKQWQNL